jgi:hypothetical protein
MQLCIFNAEGVFWLLNYNKQDLTLDHLAGIQKQSALEEAQEPESQSKERIITLTVMTEKLGFQSWH